MNNECAPDFTLLKSFLTVAETGNFATAGAALGLSQPTMSQHIQRLEQALGLPLMQRGIRPLGLTPAGALIARELPALLDQIEALTDRARALGGTTRQSLRMVMPDSLSCIMGAEFIALSGRLATAVELRSGISPWIEEAFRARQFDLAVDSPPFDPATRADQTVLFRDPYVLVRPKRGKPLTPAEFARSEAQVAYGRNSKFGAATAAIAQELGASAPPRFSFDSSQSLLRFVQAGYGWAVTSALCLFQSPAALRDIDIHPCREEQARTFFLLNRKEDAAALAKDAAARLIEVFTRLVDGPWSTLSPPVAALIRAANPVQFPNPAPAPLP